MPIYVLTSTNVILPEYDVRQLSPSALLKISESFEITWLGKAGWVAIFSIFIHQFLVIFKKNCI